LIWLEYINIVSFVAVTVGDESKRNDNRIMIRPAYIKAKFTFVPR